MLATLHRAAPVTFPPPSLSVHGQVQPGHCGQGQSGSAAAPVGLSPQPRIVDRVPELSTSLSGSSAGIRARPG